MKAEFSMVVDGQHYDKGDEIWDLGSFECTDVEGHKRSYMGLSADINKLPKYQNLATGSFALFLDTGQAFFYHSPSKTWYES